MSQANYPACVAFVRKQEGGNTDTPGDRGGRTGRGGITHTTYDAYRDKRGLPRQDVFLILDTEIADIYAAEYWNPIKGDSLPAGVDLCEFDISINSGPARALKILSQAGGLEADTDDLIHKICAARLSFMQALGSWRQFGVGWGRRVGQCEATAHQMAHGIAARPVIKAAAKAAAQKVTTHSAAAGAVVMGGAVVVGTYHEVIDIHHPLFWAAGAVVLLAVIANVLLARLHGAHSGALAEAAKAIPPVSAPAISPVPAVAPTAPVDPLAAAVKKLQDLQTAALAAKNEAIAAIDAREKAIAAEQSDLAAAKAAVESFPIPTLTTEVHQ